MPREHFQCLKPGIATARSRVRNHSCEQPSSFQGVLGMGLGTVSAGTWYPVPSNQLFRHPIDFDKCFSSPSLISNTLREAASTPDRPGSSVQR